LAHFLAEGHIGSGVAAFVLAMFAICWAWINYSWFSSSYDRDDWAYRLATLVVMVGVIVLSLGIPTVFKSIDSGTGLDNSVVVLGYVIMRLAMLSLWLRAASQDPLRRKTCLTYAVTLLIAQIGWVGLLFARPGWTAVMLVGSFLLLIELSGPVIAEASIGEGERPGMRVISPNGSDCSRLSRSARASLELWPRPRPSFSIRAGARKQS
jgi:low temperature requirement protein LtrA